MERLKQNITTTTIDGDPEETARRTELTRYVHRLVTPPTLVNDLHSALEEIEKRSQALLAKGAVALFIDKGQDSGEVVRLIERIREAITNYQVSENCFVMLCATHPGGQISQQQAIYDQITNLTVSIFRFASILYNNDRSFH